MIRALSALTFLLLALVTPVVEASHRKGYADLITFGPRDSTGLAAGAASSSPPAQNSSPAGFSSSDIGDTEGVPTPRYLPLTCVALPEGSGDTVMSLDQDACRMSSPVDDEVRRPDRLPSPYELAWLAADRAMSVAEWPRLEVAPRRVGLTGLRSYFWLQREPAPVVASASVPGLVVTAEAHPVRYRWDFGDGPVRSTAHPGRAWTKRRPGNIGYTYERRGRYPVSVEVVWQARWRMGAGAWNDLGYFSNSDSRAYSVRQMVAMLTRRR